MGLSDAVFVSFGSAAEYAAIKTKVKRYAPSINTTDSDFNTLINEMVNVLLNVTSITTYQEDATLQENLAHRRILAKLIVWELYQSSSASSFESVQIAALSLAKKSSNSGTDPYWETFLDELRVWGFSISISSKWSMLFVEYDADARVITRTPDSGF